MVGAAHAMRSPGALTVTSEGRCYQYLQTTEAWGGKVAHPKPHGAFLFPLSTVLCKASFPGLHNPLCWLIWYLVLLQGKDSVWLLFVSLVQHLVPGTDRCVHPGHCFWTLLDPIEPGHGYAL